MKEVNKGPAEISRDAQAEIIDMEKKVASLEEEVIRLKQENRELREKSAAKSGGLSSESNEAAESKTKSSLVRATRDVVSQSADQRTTQI